MAIQVALSHITHYRYDRPVVLGPQIIRLRPAPHSRTRVLSYSQRIAPDPHFVNWQQDPFANYQARVVFPEPTREFKVTIDLTAEMAVYNPFDFFLEPSAETFPFSYGSEQSAELQPYLAPEPATPLLKAFVEATDRTPTPTIDLLVAINQRVQAAIGYVIRMEPGVQTPEHTLQMKLGSCRDSSWLLVQVLRHLGLAARFASGYLIQLKADTKALDGPSGTDHDFTDLHAWCEVFLPGAGWIGLDPTSGLMAGEGHIPLACTPQPSSAAPIEGAVGRSEVEFSHSMKVTRVLETARVTQPYDDSQWQAIKALGDAVDTRLTQGDVRLTMGGEPTFVATSDRDAPEWNTDAVGPTKRGYALQLLHRLRAQYGAGGLLHLGQGKWYPGEQLPRWALSLFWRADGQPVWRKPERFADESLPASCGPEDAERLTQALARQLGLDSAHIRAGFEDAFYYQWRERRLPVNVETSEGRLVDALEQARLKRVFKQGLETPVGYALPLQVEDGRWWSSPWFFREARMLLAPGDSPMGYRLPLDSLPWVNATDFPYHIERDPNEVRAPLPDATVLNTAKPLIASARSTVTQIQAGSRTSTSTSTSASKNAAPGDAGDRSRAPAAGESAGWLTRTAVCVEARDPRRASGPKLENAGPRHQHLYVFLPPLTRLEDYLTLVACVENAAEELGLKVVLEGYPPPRDPRLKMLQVTPDPGVIEVNIHPAHSWKEVVDHTEFVYEAATQTRLCAEKFMTDGRHTGTGGGNHVVMGGATPADSPFLRRPELLASLLAYWHNHPSLSYLFSGLFIGPTSQAPRLDEARNDQLFELEIALQEIAVHCEKHGSEMPPWLVDRSLRNILIDVTGNTHRSEFCIDKLYSPDSATGRLGLLELRAFEMPPHARMSVAQQLLLRALVAKFWEQPWRGRLSRWGTGLHDRFMLSTFVRLDFEDVLRDLRDSGFDFDPAWFEPHFEFRFPHVGELAVRGIRLDLRGALEPWHVMGEEGGAGSTVRYVDSSLERLEVRVSGYDDRRYQITCNGRALPLQPTGISGEFVAGVRFKAWNPPSALHPSIEAHGPLTFDVVDTWSQRSLGGCQYHVVHPGGRSYDSLPVNSYEAESRRLTRFSTLGHTPGTIEVAPTRINPEYPHTLDLRHR
jgi:uncharacterized protein (DUF2126 family)